MKDKLKSKLVAKRSEEKENNVHPKTPQTQSSSISSQSPRVSVYIFCPNASTWLGFLETIVVDDEEPRTPKKTKKKLEKTDDDERKFKTPEKKIKKEVVCVDKFG